MGLRKDNVISYSKDCGQTPTEHTAPQIASVGQSYTPINKDKRILVQGILQAVIQSQGLLLEPGDYLDKVEQTTLRLVKFVEENTK